MGMFNALSSALNAAAVAGIVATWPPNTAQAIVLPINVFFFVLCGLFSIRAALASPDRSGD